jgi:hypothetical protein
MRKIDTVARPGGGRNNAIHNGQEFAPSDAYEACRVVYEVITYLCDIKPGIIPAINHPTFFAQNNLD